MGTFTHSIGEGNGNPLHYSFLENLMDRGALQATVARAGHNLVTKPPPTTQNMSDELGKKKTKQTCTQTNNKH